MRRLREREVTFEVKRSWRMPDLSRLVPSGGTVDTATDELRAIYYDTRQRTLQRLGVTLRRRTGGADAGWHLKVADGPARMEFQSQARSDRVPESLSRRVAGVLAGQELGRGGHHHHDPLCHPAAGRAGPCCSPRWPTTGCSARASARSPPWTDGERSRSSSARPATRTC